MAAALTRLRCTLVLAAVLLVIIDVIIVLCC